MASKGKRASSKSPSRHSSRAGDARSAASSSRLSGKAESRGQAKTPSAKSQVSGDETEDTAMTTGKASSMTSRRARGRVSDFASQGLTTVDMSGQGMTSIGGSLFSRKDIGELNLSSNNLRVVPPEIRRLTTLVHLDLSRNGIRCSHSLDYGGIPKELGGLPALEVLIISECNLPFIPPAIWSCHNLKVLDISRNKINMLIPDIGNLEKLQHLNAQQTSIMTLPPEIALCQELEEIMLWGNVIESLPETLKELPKLKVLAINYRSFCSTVDAYREGLLTKGQIQSEHIPPVLFEMPALESLDLNKTKLNNLPEKCVGKLSEFFVADNFFTAMPQIIMGMENLKILNISCNMIKSIPEEIGNLHNLTSLKMDDNKISVFPLSLGRLKWLTYLSLGGNNLYSVPPEVGNLTGLKTLVLDRNHIQRLPDTLVELHDLQTLDLTDNNIEALPMNFFLMKSLQVAHSYQKFHKYGLWLHKNPLRTPPEEVWKTDNTAQIYAFLRRQQIRQTQNLQRIKLFVMGAQNAGKTSLVQAMMTGKSFLSSRNTALLDFYPWKTDNSVSFLIYDMSGDDVYADTHPLFMDSQGVYLVVYDHATFTKDNYNETIGSWLEKIRLHSPGAIVKIVGTHTDKMDAEEIETSRQIVQSEIDSDISRWNKRLEASIADLDIAEKEASTTQETNHIKYQRFRATSLKTKALRMLPLATVSSAEGISGILSVVGDLELIAVDQTMCPNAQRYIPEAWVLLKSALKRCKNMFLTLKEVRRIAKREKFPKGELTDSLTFLHHSGEILWLPGNPEMKEIVFQRPQKLVEVLQQVFRHDKETFLDYDTNRIFRCKGCLSRDDFAKARYMYDTAGQISNTLLQCLWFYLNLSSHDFEQLLEVTQKLKLCYTVPRPEVPPSQGEFIPIMVVPAFNRNGLTSDKDLHEQWPYPLPPGQSEMAVTAHCLSTEVPQGMLEKVSCQIQDLVSFRMDWQDAVYAELETGALLIGKIPAIEGSTRSVMEVKTRGVDLKNTALILSEVWGLVKVTFSEYPGLVWRCAFKHENCDKKSIKEDFMAQLFGAVNL